MNEHLSDQQLAAVLVGTATLETLAHLNSCAACRAGQEELRAVLDSVREWARVAAARPEGFWQAQRMSIHARLERRTERIWWVRRALSAGALAAALGATVYISQPEPQLVSAVRQDPDHALLMEIEQAAERQVPRALKPAELLAQELSRAAEEKSTR